MEGCSYDGDRPIATGEIGIRLDPYPHALPGMEADAGERVDAARQVAIDKRTKTIGWRKRWQTAISENACHK
jgi:hypothetical protein